ncbi:MAG: hypothetical protein ACTSRU_01845 [Candidatus Hodarchaeales archaeon]
MIFDLLVGGAIMMIFILGLGNLYILYQMDKRNKRLDEELYQMEKEEEQFNKLHFD